MKYLFVFNKQEREQFIFDRFKYWLQQLSANAEIEMLLYSQASFIDQSLQFRPDVIVTFPFTAKTTAEPFYLLKRALNCKIVCYRNEGFFDPELESEVKLFVGLEKYDHTLVDYELFWGPLTAIVVGKRLIANGKLVSTEQVKVFGYPEYEVVRDQSEDRELAEIMTGFSGGFFLFITGFHIADYSDEEFIAAGDLLEQDSPNFEQELQLLRDGRSKASRFREKWIEKILEAARTYPANLFVVKTHPIEQTIHQRRDFSPYSVLRSLPNIICIEQGLKLKSLFPYTSHFFHYGSTAVAESYLFGVPSVFVTSRDIFPLLSEVRKSRYDLHDLGWPSSASIDIDHLLPFLHSQIKSPLAFTLTPTMKSRLRDYFSITEQHLADRKSYLPSKEIAQFLIDICHQDSPASR